MTAVVPSAVRMTKATIADTGCLPLKPPALQFQPPGAFSVSLALAAEWRRNVRFHTIVDGRAANARAYPSTLVLVDESQQVIGCDGLRVLLAMLLTSQGDVPLGQRNGAP